MQYVFIWLSGGPNSGRGPPGALNASDPEQPGELFRAERVPTAQSSQNPQKPQGGGHERRLG
jgi:hypothetical protein